MYYINIIYDMPNTPKVLLLIESARGFGRDLIEGISNYARFHGPWSFYTYAPFFRSIENNREILNRLQNEGINGIISREMSDFHILKKMNIPVIFASTIKTINFEIPKEFPTIISDNQMIGRLAAEHLMNCGFTNFAYCGYWNIGWSQDRFHSFKKALEQKGNEASNYQPSAKLHHWEFERQILFDWLASLPKPVGIMACSDDRSRDLIEAAKLIGIRIPEDVAIVGVDNDKLVCELAHPTLSSIALDTVNAGFKAAELLDNLMSGQVMPNGQKIFIKATHVEIRYSTDILALEDNNILTAVRFIRENIRKLITVDDVVNSTYLSRRTLERRFDKTFGRSIHAEICRVKVENISKMLIQTNMTQLQIAHVVGFTSVDNLRRFFHREIGFTPLEYRKKYQRTIRI